MRSKVGGKLVLSLTGAALLILLGTVVLSYEDWAIFRSATEQARYARALIDDSDALSTALLDAEALEQGFVLTGDARYLELYRRRAAEVPERLKQLVTLMADDPSSTKSRVAEEAKLLEGLVMQALAEADRTIGLAQSKGIAAAAAEVRTDEGKRIRDQIRELSGKMRSEQRAILLERRNELDLHGQRTRLATLIGSAVLFALILIGGVMLRAGEKREAGVRDLLQTTLSSIGDAVIATDIEGRVTFSNPVAQELTRYTADQAAGRPIDEIFRIVGETTRKPVESPVTKVLREGTIQGLANHTVLLRQDGSEIPIDDSGAPIRDLKGSTVGVVLVFRDITTRRKSEEDALRLASIVETSGDAIVSQTFDGVVTSWNKAAENMFGYTAEEMVGGQFSLVAPEDSPGDHVGVLERIRNGEPVVYYEASRQRKDGSRIEIAGAASPVLDRAGAIVGVSRVCRDITSRRRAEEALRRSLRHNTEILESIRDGFVAIDKDWNFTYVNAEAEKLLGKSAAELTGKNFWEQYPAAVGTPTEERLRRCIREQAAVHFEANFRELGGWYDVSLYPGFEGGLTASLRNINERKRTERALFEKEEQIRLAAEAAQIGTWHRDLTTGATRWSPQLERIFGLAPGSFRGNLEHALSLIHPGDRQWFSQSLARAAEKKAAFEFEFRLVRWDGEVRWVLTRGQPIQIAGQAATLAGIAMDMTSRKRLEEKMRQAQKLESLGILAGGIAHDFNNLLVGILGNAGVLMDRTPPESPMRETIENLMQASERAAHLTRQMLAYSGKGRMVVERLHLDRQIREILALIDASIPKGVKVEVYADSGLPPIEGDAGQIQQLIMNLAINAAEAIGPGGGTVTISIGAREIDDAGGRDSMVGDSIQPGSYVVLEVHDNGIGMDAATQAKIFDPFFTTKFTGRGLGLAAVQGIVRGHRGALTVYSEPGIGTTFKVYLPQAPHAEEAAPRPAAQTAGELRGDGKVILVVDDEELLQRTLKAALERYGYKVLTAGGGPEAIRILQQQEPDGIALVLLDMTMPGMSGEDTFSEIRAIHNGVPVVATSGYNEMEALRRFGTGLSGFIQKPYTPGNLAKKIADVLSRVS